MTRQVQPATDASPKPAAALVVRHANIRCMWSQLVPGAFVRGYSLVPVQVVDFYPRKQP